MNGEGDAGAAALLIGILPWIVISIPWGIVIYLLSKQKGRSSLTTTIFAFVPFVNWFLLVYFMGATNRLVEARLEEISRRFGTGGE